jgi:hypothetical protein
LHVKLKADRSAIEEVTYIPTRLPTVWLPAFARMAGLWRIDSNQTDLGSLFGAVIDPKRIAVNMLTNGIINAFC